MVLLSNSKDSIASLVVTSVSENAKHNTKIVSLGTICCKAVKKLVCLKSDASEISLLCIVKQYGI